MGTIKEISEEADESRLKIKFCPGETRGSSLVGLPKMKRRIVKEEQQPQVGITMKFSSLRLFLLCAILAPLGQCHSASTPLDQVEEAVSAVSQVAEGRKKPLSNGSNFGVEQNFDDLVAIGAISLLEPQPASAAPITAAKAHLKPHPSGRLVDQIATSASPSSRSKLSYIIEFMRVNRLTKFCDLLTGQEPEVRSLSARLEALDRFTLFVPTNEALLLMSADQLERLRARPGELRQFLAAHATAELVLPKLAANSNLLASSRLIAQQANWPPSQVQRRQLAAAASSTTLAFSLAGSPMRITTIANDQNESQKQSNQSGGTKLELIINGANVLSGQSYALQEPNNSSLTYAIVHLLDRVLYPAPSQTLINLLRSKAASFARLVELAKDPLLDEALESSAKLSTLFVPNEEAFKAVPAKLLQQLQSNQTFLVQFLRTHLIEGLYFSGQLSQLAKVKEPPTSSSSSATKLATLARNTELEFEFKTVQLRTLVLVNSIPIIEPDLMALNGVIHLISRPIFERHQLEACKCYDPITGPQGEASARTGGSSSSPSPISSEVTYEFDNRPIGNELERDESQLVRSESSQAVGAKLRAQRSGAHLLVARNNRDFYRPLAAPANLLIAAGTNPSEGSDLKRQDSLLSAELLEPAARSNSSLINRSRESNGAELFERYKIVMNATTRQQLREQQNFNQPSASSSSMQFVYDRPLSSSSTASSINTDSLPIRRAYSPITFIAANQTNWTNNATANQADLLTGSASREQRLLKFQPEDARDQTVGPIQLFANSSSRLNLAESASNNLQPAYDYLDQSSPGNGRQAIASVKLASPRSDFSSPSSKTSASPSSSFTGCAFYDTECKRLLSRLVRLPSGGRTKTVESSSSTSSNLMLITNNNSTSSHAHLDSTFGETSDHFGRLRDQQTGAGTGWPGVARPGSQLRAQHSSGWPNSARLSPLNQPLPPWSDDEQHRPGAAKSASSSWRLQEGDIGRIVSPAQVGKSSKLIDQTGAFHGHGFTGGLSRLQEEFNQRASAKQSQSQIQPQPQNHNNNNNNNNNNNLTSDAHILLVPVGLVQEANFVGPNMNSNQQVLFGQQNFLNSSGNSQPPINWMHNPTFFLNHSSPRPPLIEEPSFQVISSPESSSRLRNSIKSANVMFSNGQQYHRPTPYSVSMQTTHTPAMFNPPSGSTFGRLSNFTAFESSSSALGDAYALDGQPGQAPKSRLPNPAAGKTLVPVAPSAHRKLRPAQVRIENNGSFGANFELNPASGVKQARKLVRLQKGPAGSEPAADDFSGDISITSARLAAATGAAPGNNGQQGFGAGLATQASNQRVNVSANFVRSAPATSADQNEGDPQLAADFFQDRTIAEIMDDSGLRIDHQQVTFNRLKECLAQADLLSLTMQTGNALTIFMPTDLAFQRLVQEQALAHQRERDRQKQSTFSARLIDPSRRYLIPLIARRGQSGSSSSSSSATTLSKRQASELSNNNNNNNNEEVINLVGPEIFSASDLAPFATAAEKLTLDCSSSQVRQLLLDHLSARLITPKQLQVDTGISSLSGRKLLMSSVPSKKIVVVDGQPVIAATRAKNGMVYVLHKFLNITHQVPNVIQLIESQPNLTTFLSYLSFSSLSERLRREPGPLTILAPTNEAFEQLSSSARQLINSDPSALMDILRGHIIEGFQFGKLISMRNRLKTMNSDQFIEAKVIKPNVYLLDNQMTSIRLVATTGNGVLNTIDRLIVPTWLKVSIGGTTAKPIGALSTPLRGQVDSSMAMPRNQSSLNLPIISGRPMRFEQPETSRSTTSPNSFLFASGDSGNSINSIGSTAIDSFDLPAGIGTSNSANETLRNSPFLRLANSSSNSSNNNNNNSPTNRLSSGAGDQRASGTGSSLNATRNMQLIEKLANLMQARKFIKYMFKSRVSETLKPDMNYVILIPTDQAIDKLPRQIVDALERDPDRLVDLVNYHVLDTTFEYINAIPDGQTLNTLNEKDILFNWHKNNTILTASGAVVMGGIQEDNIALLLVDRVLYPTPGDLLSLVSKSPILSNFTSLIRNAGLERQLSLAGPFTLFVPSDFAFNQLDKRDFELLQRNRESARRFLLRHLSQPAVFTSSIALSSLNTTASEQLTMPIGARQSQVPIMVINNLLGEDLTLRQRNDYFSVNEVNFSYADVAATNGVVHVIDGLL